MAFFIECSLLSKQKDIFTSLYTKLSVVDVFVRDFTYQFVESTDQIFRKLYNVHILRQVIVKIKMYEILNTSLEKGNIIIMKNGRILFKKWSLNCINVYAYFEYLFFYNNIGSILWFEVSAMKKNESKFKCTFRKFGAQNVFTKISVSTDVGRKICVQHGNNNQRNDKDKTFF